MINERVVDEMFRAEGQTLLLWLKRFYLNEIDRTEFTDKMVSLYQQYERLIASDLKRSVETDPHESLGI